KSFLTWRRQGARRGPRLAAGPLCRPGERLFGLRLVLALLLRLLALVFLAAGLLGLGDGCTQDVTEAGAGIRRAELLEGLLVLLDLARLDGKAELAGLGVDDGDLGVDLVADGEAVRALLAALARQLGFADEALGPVAEGHLDAALGDRRHRA